MISIPIRMSVFLFFISFITFAQKVLTIEEVNAIAMIKSNRIKMATNNLLKNNIENSFYENSLLPKISSTINFPYQRSISGILQPDGSQKFIEQNNIFSSYSVNISQALPFTGGIVSINSSINGSRDFNNKLSSFSSNWVNVSYQQQINGYNSFKWDKKLNKLAIIKDSIAFLKDKINLKFDVSKQYVDTQLLQMKIELLKVNIDKTQRNLTELEEKFKYGQTIKIEVEQTKVTLEQLQSQLEISKMDYQAAIKVLKNLIEYGNDEDFTLQAVQQDDYILDPQSLKAAIRNNGFELDKAIQLLQSDSNIDKVKKESAVSINLQLGMGLNSSAKELSDLYSTPSQSQFVTIGARIPILDWGLARKKIDLARLDRDYVEYNVIENEKKMDNQLEEFINYKISLIAQKKSLSDQVALSKKIMDMYDELLSLGRKTAAEYKVQLAETFNINLQYQEVVNNLYLPKLKINEINLVF